MAIVKIILTLALIVEIQFIAVRCSNSFPSSSVTRSEGLKKLFGKDFESDLQSQSLAFTSGTGPRPFANEEVSYTGPSIDLLETDKSGPKDENAGGDVELAYTKSGNKNKHDESHEISSPRVRQIMLLKARATTKATEGDSRKGIVNQDENGYERRPEHSITRVTLRNIFNQIGRKEEKIGDGQSDEEVRDAASGSAIRSETESSGWSTFETAESSNEPEGVTHELETGSKNEPEFAGKNTGASRDQGSGDRQFPYGGMRLPQDVKGANVANVVSESARDKPERTIIKGEGNSGSEKLPFDPILLFQVRNIRTNVLKAEKQATMELNDVRKEFRAKMEDLQEDLKMVRKLTSNVHRKVGITVKQALAMARQAKTNATNRLAMARKAATALNNIEKKLGVIHTINASRILRSKIPQFPKYSDVTLYQQLLATNRILTKLDGAKVMAIDRAERRFRNEEETGSSISQEVDSLRDELASAEEELSEETDREMEDEREAQEKIQEALERNKLVAKKTAFALTAIENYLEKLQSDEAKLKRFRF